MSRIKQFMNNTYAFCRETKMPTSDLLQWLDIELHDDFTCKINDRWLRWINGNGHDLIQISESVKTFDKWSNSVDLEFEMNKRSDKIRFIDYVEESNNVV